MAIIKLGTTVVGIRGTMGGQTFSRNKSGPYVKAWSSASIAPSLKRVAQQARLGALPAEWHALAQALRDAWDVWADLPAQELTNPLGETYKISGFNWFIKINIQLLLFPRPIRTAVPTQSRPTIPTITNMFVRTGDVLDSTITYPSGTFSPNLDLVLYIAMTNSTSPTAFPASPKLTRRNVQPPLTSDTFQDEVEDAFGLVQMNRRWFGYMVRATTDGLVSPPALIFTNTDPG